MKAEKVRGSSQVLSTLISNKRREQIRTRAVFSKRNLRVEGL